jgi:hypothetical protein
VAAEKCRSILAFYFFIPLRTTIDFIALIETRECIGNIEPGFFVYRLFTGHDMDFYTLTPSTMLRICGALSALML